PIASHSCWMAGPPLRRMAPATPPPNCRSLLAAFTIASVAASVRSPCLITTLSRHPAPIAALLLRTRYSSAIIWPVRNDRKTVGMRMRRGPGMVGALALCAALGCGRPAPPPPRFLQVDIENSPTSTDPRFATDAISSRINELVFDSLVRVDRHGRFVGQLAESFERPDETHIVFHLKRGIRFSNGREMTARDVKY